MLVSEWMAKHYIEYAADDTNGYTNDYPDNQWWRDKKNNDCGSTNSKMLHDALLKIGVDTGNNYFEPTGSKKPWNEEWLLKYCNRFDYANTRNRVGDILTSNGHTEMVVSVRETNGKGYDELCGARGDYDGKSGDSSGREVAVSPYFNASGSGWNYIYRLKPQYDLELGTSLANGLTNEPDKDGRWPYYKNGKVDTSVTTVALNKNGWWYVKDGYVDFTFNGIASNSNGSWKIKDGAVDWGYTGIANWGDGTWQRVVGGRATKDSGVFQNENGWWYVKDGIVDFKYNGIAQNENGIWRIVNGKVDFADGIYEAKVIIKGGRVITNVAGQ